MNQILYAEEPKRNNPIDKKKILLFFAIAIAIFGIVLVIVAVSTIGKNKKNEKTNKGQDTHEVPVPIVTLAQEGDEKAVINVESETAISHIIYSWNNESAQTIEETGKTTVEEILDIPVGENILYVSAIDTNGNETKQQKTYVLEATKPVIELSVIGNNIKIKVTSETELSYVSYKWNSESEVKDDMYTYEDRTIYEKTIEIPTGENTLKIEAEDINRNKNEKSQDIKAYPKAVTQVVSENGYLDFTVTGTDNIETVEFELNGNKYTMNTDTFGQTNVVHYKVKMDNGWNYLAITSTTVNKATDTTYWKYEYKSNATIIQ